MTCRIASSCLELTGDKTMLAEQEKASAGRARGSHKVAHKAESDQMNVNQGSNDRSLGYRLNVHVGQV